MTHSTLFRRLVLILQAARRDHLKANHLPDPIPASQAGWSRRRFIKTSAAAGFAGAVSSSLAPPAWAKDRGDARVAIIGAGIAGLNAAYRLKKAGVAATVFEAHSRVGGRMLSASLDDGLTIDLGAELINTNHPDMLGLAKDFGIKLFDKRQDAARLPYPKEVYFFNGERFSEAQLADDLRAIAAQIHEDAGLLDQDWETHAPLFDQWSVSDYLHRHADKIGAPYVRSLLGNMLRTEFGAETSQASALQLIDILPVVDGQAVDLLSYSDEVYAVVGGSARITDALARALAGQIHLRKALRALKLRNDEYHLTFSDGSRVEADIVIIATPFPALRNVELDAPLPALFRRFVAEANPGANEKLIAGFKQRFWHSPAGFSLAAWTDFGYSEVWDETQRQPHRRGGALNFFLGGDQARQLNNTGNIKPLAKQFITDLDKFIPGAKASASGGLAKSAWGNNPYAGGGYANFAPGQLSTFAEFFWVEGDGSATQQVAFDKLIFAGEHLSDANYGFMEGGAQTGRLAAALALDILQNHRE
ncbi:NAD(P)-binding protein [Methylococcaceae bacterium WWC4]|nr:NAD(P)-binding protein [Methylococcaceae bacterium WWC4]